MTTLTLPNKAGSLFTLSGDFGFTPRKYKKKNAEGHSVLVVEREAVFRSGTFRDSMGYQNTWESIHMQQMLANYNYLVANNLFKDVPVRDGHPGFLINGQPGMGKNVGWHTGLEIETLAAPHDGVEYDYVFASFELLDPAAIAAYESGLFRNRSAEIISYASNAEAEFWPVYAGFAFVDIPAVEGLNFSRDPSTPRDHSRVLVMFDKEIPAMTAPLQGAPAPTDRPALGGPANAPHVFSVNGQPVTDYSAVQRHITVLETAQREAQAAGREAFVKDLSDRGVILATAVDHFNALAVQLDQTGWELFCKGYEGAGTSSIVAQHASPASGVGGTLASNGAATGGPQAVQAQEIEDAKQVVAAFRAASMKPDQLKATPSYKKLVAAGIESA
jgi:hypothetical protein